MSSNAGAPKVTFQMASFIILFLAVASLVVESAATGRATLSANSNATVEATSKSQVGTSTQWVQITAVPLAVFLIGACMWDIIQNRVQKTAASIIGTVLSVYRRLALIMKAVLHAPAENHLINDVGNAGLDSAQEEGLALPHCAIDATGLAAALNSPATDDARDGMLLELSNGANDVETEDVGASVQTQV